jgi:putative endonuclease
MGVVDRSKLGEQAEEQCAEYLQRAGYRVRERNWWVREGELDIVAERGELLCFVEVRMRSSAVFGDPSLTVTREKQRRVVRAALRYLQRWPAPQRMIRFDVMTVLGRGKDAVIEHLPGAFDAGM